MPTQSQQAVRHDDGYTDPQAPAGYDTDPLVELARIVSEGPVFGGRHAPPIEAPSVEAPAFETTPAAPPVAPPAEARPAAAAPVVHVAANPVPAEPVFEAVPEPVAAAPEVVAYSAPDRGEPEYSQADLSRELEAELMGDPSLAVAADAAPSDPSDEEAARAQSEYEQELHRQYLEQQAAYEAELAAYNAAIAAMKAQAGGVGAETGPETAPTDAGPNDTGPTDANIVDLGQSMADLSAKRAVTVQPEPQHETAPRPAAAAPVAAPVAADDFDPDFRYDFSGLTAATPAPDMDMTVEGQKPDDERSGRGLLVAASIVGILLLGGASYAGYRALAGAAGPQEPRIIRADGGDFKRYPDVDGATKTTGKSEMARLEGGAKGPERLVSREETPVRTVPTTETGGDGGTMAGGAREGAPSRTVRTFVVRPDGSFTSKKMLPTTVTSSGKNAVIRTVSVRTIETGGSSGEGSTGSVIMSSKTGAPLIKAPARTTKSGEGSDTAITVETGSSSDEAGDDDTGGSEPRTMTTTSESGGGSTRPDTIRDVLKRPMTSPGEGSTATRKAATTSSGDDTETESGTSTASSDDGDTETETVATATRKTTAAKPTRKTRSTSASTGTDPLPVRRVRTTRTTTVEKPANAPLSLLPDSTSGSTKTRRTTTRTASAAPVTTSTATSAATGTAAGSGAYMIQIYSDKSEELARSTYSKLQRRYPSQLGNRAPIVRSAEVGSRGVYYRVYIGRFDRAEAYRVCGDLKNAGGDCLVKRR